MTEVTLGAVEHHRREALGLAGGSSRQPHVVRLAS